MIEFTETPRIKTFIYGSCVSRDTFNHLNPNRFELVRYLARQSALSAVSPPTAFDLDLGPLSSRFQRRMVRGSLTGNLFESLEDAQPDLILWDLTDERTGAFELPDRTFVTRMVELDQAGLTERITRTNARYIQFGTSEHFALWTISCNRIAENLARLGLLDHTMLVAPPWAETDDYGDTTPQSYGLTATQANTLMQPYLEHIETILGRSRVTSAEAIADRENRWGFAPFHYKTSTYQNLAARISASTLNHQRPVTREPSLAPTPARQTTIIGDAVILSEFRGYDPSQPTVIVIETLTKKDIRDGAKWAWSDLNLDGIANLVYLNDPTLSSHEAIAIGWGMGTRNTPGIPALLKLIHHSLGPDGRNRIYVGAGAAGFIATQLSIRDCARSAILCNPDLGWYERKAPQEIVSQVLGDAHSVNKALVDVREIQPCSPRPSLEVFVNQSHPEQWNSQLRILADLLDTEPSQVSQRTSRVHTYKQEKAPFSPITPSRLQDAILAEIDRLSLEN
jgi:hypothetical protein